MESEEETNIQEKGLNDSLEVHFNDDHEDEKREVPIPYIKPSGAEKPRSLVFGTVKLRPLFVPVEFERPKGKNVAMQSLNRLYGIDICKFVSYNYLQMDMHYILLVLHLDPPQSMWRKKTVEIKKSCLAEPKREVSSTQKKSVTFFQTLTPKYAK
jgi:hypothetical protein